MSFLKNIFFGADQVATIVQTRRGAMPGADSGPAKAVLSSDPCEYLGLLDYLKL